MENNVQNNVENNVQKDDKKSKKLLLIILGMIVVAAIIILLLLGLGDKKGDGEKVSATPKVEKVSVDTRSLLMKSGETVKLTTSKENAEFSSSNPEVATVDATGNVTAVKKGNALITITLGEEKAYCGVIVDGMGTMVDITKQKAKVIFSDVLLEEPEAITSLAVDISENAYYLAQPYATTSYEILPSDIVVSKVAKNEEGTWATTDWMRFYESGTGTIAIEKDGIDTYLLLESNGTYYGSGNTLSSVKWESEGFGQEEYGTIYNFSEVSGSASPAVDSWNDMVVVYDNVKKSYLFYDRNSLQSGEDAVYLHEAVCANGQQPVAGVDDSQGFYNATIRDFAVADGYIYQICGSSSMYVSVFDLNGTLQYCYRVPDYAEDMEVRMPGGIACEAGKVYIAVGSHNSSYYLGNVWMFE